MATPIRMPQPGQMTEGCTVVRWLKAEGDRVARGEPLFEIETDKSNMEVEAFDDGVLLRVLVGEGETVPVETVVAWIGQPGEQLPHAAPAKAEAAHPKVEAANREAAHRGAGAQPGQAEARPARPAAASAHLPAASRRPAVSPRASRLAGDLGVDPRRLVGTGPGGRIVERDVRSAAAGGRAAAGAEVAAPGRAAVSADGAAALARGQPLSRLRQTIARRLTESTSTIPQFSLTVAVDMSGLVALRAELREAGSPVSLTDLIHAAAVQTLVEFPLVNSLTDGHTLWLRERVHLGIAVSVPGGLLVPVLQDAHLLDIGDLHERATRLILAARAGRLAPDESTGSTFSVSNLGMHGVEAFTAIINPGESGILAVASVRPEAVASGGGLAVRHLMRLTLTADHRIVDGELGARFLNGVRRRLEDAQTFRALLTAG